jgi:hypothetical protein
MPPIRTPEDAYGRGCGLLIGVIAGLVVAVWPDSRTESRLAGVFLFLLFGAPLFVMFFRTKRGK